ncbi:glycerophosphodiester phosphodiesterase [Paraglaciecola sp.]|uniref:glycerophosphodiester phosphodiesterase n=1 Tax=Paraglaciecola sp. TaxID=1920173 RepID=UPI003EF5B657
MRFIRNLVCFELFALLVFVLIYKTTALPQQNQVGPFGGLVFLHRGDASTFPENSIAAMRAASEAGAQAIEVDVMLSQDNVPMVFHDPSLERTTNGHGNVKDFTAESLQQLRLVNSNNKKLTEWHIPSLEAVMQEATSLGLILEIELKTEIHNHYAMAQKIAALFERFNYYQQGFISSFDPRLLYYVRSLNPKINTSLALKAHPPYSAFTQYVLQQPFTAKYLGISMIEPDHLLATEKFIQFWLEQNMLLNIWVVNSDKLKKALLQPNISITTDCLIGSC